MARFPNNSNSNFPSKNVWFRKGKQLLPLTNFSCDQGKTGWTNTLKTPGRQLTAAKPGCRWWRRGPKTVITKKRIRDPLITVHGILDPWCQQHNYYYDHLISCFLLWCLFDSHGPKTSWLLLTPSQGCSISMHTKWDVESPRTNRQAWNPSIIYSSSSSSHHHATITQKLLLTHLAIAGLAAKQSSF
jgi:hypothetical protein